jgi:hypothetical protein
MGRLYAETKEYSRQDVGIETEGYGRKKIVRNVRVSFCPLQIQPLAAESITTTHAKFPTDPG